MKRHAIWRGGCGCSSSCRVPALAHHGWSGYGDKPFEMAGTVQTPVSLAGPLSRLRHRIAVRLDPHH
jgi:hypothetical protein